MGKNRILASIICFCMVFTMLIPTSFAQPVYVARAQTEEYDGPIGPIRKVPPSPKPVEIGVGTSTVGLDAQYKYWVNGDSAATSSATSYNAKFTPDITTSTLELNGATIAATETGTSPIIEGIYICDDVIINLTGDNTISSKNGDGIYASWYDYDTSSYNPYNITFAGSGSIESVGKNGISGDVITIKNSGTFEAKTNDTANGKAIDATEVKFGDSFYNPDIRRFLVAESTGGLRDWVKGNTIDLNDNKYKHVKIYPRIDLPSFTLTDSYGNTFTNVFVGDTIKTSLTASADFQWYTVVNNIKTEINNATGSTFTATKYELGKYLLCKATGTGDYKGIKEATTGFAVKNKLDGLTLDKTAPLAGDEITATIAPAAADAAVTYQWYASTSMIEPLNADKIDGATAKTYQASSTYAGKYLHCIATATSDGAYGGSIRAVTTEPLKIGIESCALSGDNPMVGLKITATAFPQDATVTYQWYALPTPDTVPADQYKVGTNEDNYSPTSNDVGKYICCVVNGTGNYKGNASKATANAVVSPTYTITAAPATLDFGEKMLGYQISPDAIEVTVTNTGNRTVTPKTFVANAEYTIATPANWTEPLEPTQTRKFTVQPKTGLTVGEHNQTLGITTDYDSFADVALNYKVNPVPTYGISLTPTSKDYDDVIVGYTKPTAATVTVNNTGNQATGELTLALEGTDKAYFEIDKTEISSIAVDGNGSFSVGPIAGLEARDTAYTATVKISGNNGISASFTVTIKVNPVPTYSVSLTPSTKKVFDAVTLGYTMLAANAHKVKISNTGNQPTGDLTIALTGTGKDAFKPSDEFVSSLAKDGSFDFSVIPNANLGAGTYEAVVEVSGKNVDKQSFKVSFTVNAKPVVKIDGNTSIKSGGNTTLTANVTTGGTAPFTYSWSTGATTQSITVSPTADTKYTVTVTDKDGVTANAEATVTVSHTVILNLTLDGAPDKDGNIKLRDKTDPTKVYELTYDEPSGGYKNTEIPDGEYEVLKDGEPTGKEVTVEGQDITTGLGLDYFTVSFEANGGTPAPANQVVLKNGKVTPPANIIKNNFVFDKWYSNEGLTEEWNFATSTVTAKTTLYAKWIAATHTITITKQPEKDTTLAQGDANGKLTVEAAVSEGGTPAYNWYACDKDGNKAGERLGTGDTFTIPTDAAGTFYYVCVTTSEGAEPVTSEVATVTVTPAYNPDPTPVIEFTLQPAKESKFKQGEIYGKLTAAARVVPSGTPELNWYACDENGIIAGESLKTGGEFAVPTTLEEGAYYFLCRATYAGARDANSDLALVKVEKEPDPVVVNPVTAIEMIKTREMNVGRAEYLSAKLSPDGALLKHLAWTTSDAGVASVDETGLVTALSLGTAVITAASKTDPGVTASCLVTVTDDVLGSRDLPIKTLTLDKGAVFDLIKHFGEYAWTSDDEGVARVNKKGKLKAKGVGTTVIRGTLGGVASKSALVGDGIEISVTVLKNGNAVDDIKLQPAKIEVAVGAVKETKVTIKPADATDKTLVWTTSDASVAAVDKDGRVMGVAVGEAVITVTASSGVQATAKVEVVAGTPPTAGVATAITLSADSRTQFAGEKTSLTVIVTPANADLSGLKWESADANVASVDQTGVITGVLAGKTTVTARLGELSASCRVTVEAEDDADETLAVNVDMLALAVGKKAKLQILAGAKGTWTVSDTNVATITKKGNLKAKAKGDTTLTFTVGKLADKNAKFMGKSLLAGDSVRIDLHVVEQKNAVKKIILPEDVLVAPGERKLIEATVKPKTATYKKVFWISADPSIATVDGEGRVTGVALGEVSLTAIATSGVMKTVVVTVSNELELMTLTRKKAKLNVGERLALGIRSYFPEGIPLPTITWTSKKPEVATVDENGLVTAVSSGSTVITATASTGVKAKCTVRVK